MHQLSNFRYKHSSLGIIPMDCRLKQSDTVVMRHLYFLGFKSTLDYVDEYHHALILADDHTTLLEGLEREMGLISKLRPGLAQSDISLVFVRNLLMREPTLVSDEERELMTNSVKEKLVQRNDDQFVLLGMLGREKVILMDYVTTDALAALRLARFHSANQFGKSISPLDICQAHPVTKEFEKIYEQQAEYIWQLMHTGKTGSVH